MKISFLQNPAIVRQTKSFLVSVQDRNTKGIAVVNSDVYYTTTPGKIANISLKSQAGVKIGEIVDMKLDFTPLHAVQGISSLLIEVPKQMTFSCTLTRTVGLKTAPVCVKVDTNLFRFSQPFNNDVYAGNQTLSLVFS